MTRLKAAGIDLAAMGDVAGTGDPGGPVEELTFADPARGTYARLRIRDERLTGAILLGDNPAVGTVVQLFDRGAPVPADRRSLLLGRAFGEAPAGPAASPALMPDAATVCRCNDVTKGALVACWRAGARTAAALSASTRAAHRLRQLPGRGGRHRRLARRGRPAGDRRGTRDGGGGVMSERLVVVGNGMVGQRFVEALRARDTGGRWRVTVLAEERRPAYDRVRLSAVFDGVDADELTVHTPDAGVDLRLGEPATGVDRARRGGDHGGRRVPVRRAGAGHRLVRVRAAGRRHRPAGRLRLPDAGRPGRDPGARPGAAHRRGDRRRAARPGGGERAAAARARHAAWSSSRPG